MKKSACVVIPIWKPDLDKNEEISFRQCLSTLQNYPIIAVTYRGLDLRAVYSVIKDFKDVDFNIEIFPSKFFAGISGYNSLMLSIQFYDRFKEYDYILVSQLDSFVFRDELSHWVSQGYSYIGAPWLEGYDSAPIDAEVKGVGNGGFSLRRVNDHLKVLKKLKYIIAPTQAASIVGESDRFQRLPYIGRLIINMTVANNTFYLFNDWSGYEDLFWNRCSELFTWFKIPAWEIAAKFSVEMHPQKFITDENDIPFGCHAWWKHNMEFWEPHIERWG